MAQTSSEFLAGLRNVLRFSKSLVRASHRRQFRHRSDYSHSCETLEERQLLVQPPVSLLVNSGTTAAAVTVQWVQPQQSPAASFDMTVTRTGIAGGGAENVLYETALSAASTPGELETYKITEPLPAGSYSVSLVSRGLDGSVSTQTTNTFVISQVTPQLLRISGQRLVGYNTPNSPVVSSAVSLSWTVLPGVNSYYVWIGKKSGTPAQYLQIADLAPRSVQGGVYEGNLATGDYRVWVGDLNGPPNIWSAPMDFSVVGLDSFIPVWNSTSITIGQGSFLSWSPVPTAVRYDVEISGTATTTASVAGTEYRSGFLAAGNYSTRVRGYDATDQPLAWSVALPFTISSTSYRPQISASPVGAQVNGVSAIVWNAVGWADTYEITLKSTAGTIVFQERTRVTSFSPPLLPLGTYNVTIKSFDTLNASVALQSVITGNFQVTSTTYKPTPPTFVQGASGSQVLWARVNGATRYDVWIDRMATGSFTAQPSLAREFRQGEFFSLDNRFAAGATYKTWVRPVYSDGKVGVWSNAAQFLVSKTPAISVVLSTGSDVRLPRIEWTAYATAVSYRVKIIDKTIAASQVAVVDKVGLTRSFYAHDVSLAAGTYYGWVEATLANNLIISGSSADFIVAAGPTGTTQNQAPQFTWPSISGAASYDLWVAKQDLSIPGTETAQCFPSVNVPANSYVHHAPLEAGSYVYWYISRDSSGALFGNWSAAIPFIIPAQLNLPIPDLLHISLSNQSQAPVVEWDSTQSGLADIRIMRVEQPQAEVLREQYFVASSSATRNSYAVHAGLAPGLYRIDVGPHTTPASAPSWANGPVFYFDGNRVNTLQAPGAAQTTSAPNVAGPFRGDFDGDGNLDLVKRNLSNGELTVSINNSTALASSTWNANGTGDFSDFISSQSSAPLLIGDFNGDGRDDLVQPDMSAGIWSVMRSGTSGAFEKITTPVTGLLNPDLPVLAWDSQVSVLSWNAVSSPNSNALRTYELQVVLNEAATSYPRVVSTITRSAVENTVASFTESLAALAAGEYTVFVRTSVNGRVSQWSEGYGITTTTGIPPANTSAWQNYLAGDFNGDRRDDIAAYNSVRQQWAVALSTGTSFEQTVWTSGFSFNLSSGTNDVYSRQTAIDVNGDGRKDIIAKNNMTGQWIASISTGTSFLTQTWAAPAFLLQANVSATSLVADLDADGKEDIVAWVGSSLRAVFSRENSFQDSAGGVTWPAVSGMPGNTAIVDMNSDGRPDLVGFDGSGKSVVARASAAGFGTPTVWEVNPTTPWAIQLQDSGVVVSDYNYRTRSVLQAFHLVHNTIEFEAYRGLKKGADGTLSTKSGNAWDQTNLLGTLIANDTLTKTEYVTGRMGLNAYQVKSWLTTETIPIDYFLQAGLNPTPLVNADPITIDHAWLRAWLPTATGLGWVDLNSALKASLAPASEIATAPLTATDLNAYLNPVTNSFSADFDAGGAVTDYNLASIPAELKVSSGGAIAVTDPTWPKLGSVDDYKILTSHSNPTNMFVDEAAVNGTLSSSIFAQAVNGAAAQDFRVFARATDNYEVGVSWSGGLSQEPQLYDRVGTSTLPLNGVTATQNPTDAPAFSPVAVSGLVPCSVQLTIDGSVLTAFVQWRDSAGTTQKRKLVATLLTNPAGGRFGIYTGGAGHHYLDNIQFTGTHVATASPLDWMINQKLHSADPSVRAGANAIGQTRTIIQTTQPTVPVSLVASTSPDSLPSPSWNPKEFQTITFSFIALDGSIAQRVAGSPGGSLLIPTRIAELSRKNIVVWTDGMGRQGSLKINGVDYGTSLSIPSGVVRLQVDVRQTPGSAPETQILALVPGYSSQVVLGAGQYSATDVANLSDQLADAYDEIPVLGGAFGNDYLAYGYNTSEITRQTLSYSASRLLMTSEQTENEIAKLTNSILVRPSVSVGLISGRSFVIQPDSVYFIRPKDMTVDFPIGKLLYVPRNGGAVSQSDAVQQSRALLTLAELSAGEHELLSELSDKPATSALTLLSQARLNGHTVRRLTKAAGSTYFDEWGSIPAGVTLSSILGLATTGYQGAAYTLINDQLNAGGVVTVSTSIESIGTWTGVAWLHENYSGTTPIIESLMASTVNGRVLHGGITDAEGGALSADFSQLQNSGAAPDGYQGILRKSDTDFTLSIPGMSIPLTRTWTSSRSDVGSTDSIVNVSNLGDFGSGWSSAFSQQLDITTITDAAAYSFQKNYRFGQITVPVNINGSRKGEATSIAWRRDDGSTGIFIPNGTKTALSADYDSPLNIPGVIVRRLDGGVAPTLSYGDFYEVVMADGSVYGFQDFNTQAIRQAGQTKALLISIADRFGNKMLIQRDAAVPTRITQIIDAAPAGRILAKFTYTNALITRIEIPASSTGIAPVAGISGTRIWDYSYDAGSHLSHVKVSENSGTGAAVQLASTLSRYHYVWYEKIGTIQTPQRGDRLEHLMKSASGYAGDATDTGTAFATTFEYYGNGRLRSIRDAEGGESRFIYNAYDRFTSVVDAAGYVTTNQFSDFGDLVTSISQSGERTIYDMAANVRQVAKTTATNGRSESWQYDAKGNATKHTDAAAISQIMTYHPVYNQVATIDEESANGTLRRILTNIYFDLTGSGGVKGGLATSTDALSNATSYTYTAQGLVAEITSAQGHSTKFDRLGYDVFGNPQVVDHRKFANGVLTTVSSDASVRDNTGSVDYVKDYDKNGILQPSTNFAYDPLKRLLETLSPDPYIAGAALRTQYLYGQNGLLERRINSDGSIYRYSYDNAGRVLREIRPDGTFTSVEYNANGTVAAQIDANGNKTVFVYDVLNRLSQTIFANGTTRALVYNAKGDLVSEFDELGSEIRYKYDLAGRLSKTTDAAGNITTYGYDAFGNQNLVETAMGVVTTTFNAQHQPVQTLFETTTTTNGTTVRAKVRVDHIFYDANGNQERLDSIDLRPDPVLMTAASIATLTDATVTRAESDTVNATRKRIASTAYDFRDKAVSGTDAAQNISSKSYSLGMLLTTSTDVRGARTQFGYDLAGGLQFEALPYAGATDIKGISRVMRRDKMGRVVEVLETPYSLNASQAVLRDANGEPTAPVSGEVARISKTSFDTLGRAVASQNAVGFVTRVTFDPAGNMVETIDASRRSTLNLLDNMNRTVRQVLPAVSVVESSTSLAVVAKIVMPFSTTAYDPAGNVIAATDPAGNTTTFQFDTLNRIIQKTAPAMSSVSSGAEGTVVVASPVWSWTYDALGHIATATDPLQRVTVSRSDMFGQVISTTQADPDGNGALVGLVMTFTFDAFGNLLEELDKGNPSLTTDDRRTVHEYNSQNLKTKTTLPDPDNILGNGVRSPVLQWSFDAAGNLTASTDALNRTTNYTYDARNLLIKSELPAVANGTGTARPTSMTTYDLFGDVKQSTDALGRSTNFEHDALGRTVFTVSPHPDGAEWSGLRALTSETQFDAVGNVIRVTDQLGRQSTSAYDNLNRLMRTTSPDPFTNDFETAASVTVVYDINGNLARQTDALGHVTRFEYDALNRVVLTAVQDDTGWAVTQTWFDLAGNSTRTTDVRGNSTDYSYNSWNQLIKVQQAAADSYGRPTTTTTYDQFGNVKSVTDPRGGVTESQYDNLDRLIRTISPVPGSGITRPESVFAYDIAGNLYKTQILVSRNASNVEVWTESVQTFDALNRPLSSAIRGERIPDGQTLTTQQLADQTLTSQTYDLLGNVLTAADAEGRTTTFEYDRLNRKITQIAPKATTNVNDTNPVTRFRFDTAGNLAATIDPLGRITTQTYDLLDRALTTTSPDPDGLQGPLPAPLMTSVYDVLGNLLSTTDQLARQTVSAYDTRNRVISLTQADPDLQDSLAAPTSTVVYDIAGNKIRSTDAMGNVTDYEYDQLNRLKSMTLPDASPNDRLGRPVILYAYDLAGNMVATTDAAGRTSNYEYDGLNRKTKEQLPDPDGVGLGRVRPTTLFSYDAVGNVLMTTDYITAGMNRITQNEFDYLNRVTKTTLPAPTSGAAQSVTIYGYDKVGNQTTVTSTSTAVGAPQEITKFVFDMLNRLVQTQSQNPQTGAIIGGPVSVNTFDLVGRLITSTDPLLRVTTYFYDDLDRQVRIVGADPDGIVGGATADKIPSETRYVYDPAGNAAMTQTRRKPDPLSAVLSSAGVFNTTVNRYDRLDRVTSVIDANGGITQYLYDNNGNQILLTDASFNTTRWQFDAQGHMVSETDPNRLSIVYEFDLVGNVAAITDRRGYRTQYVRDNLDNVRHEQWLQPSGTNVAFVSQIENWYDNYNRLWWTQQRNQATGQLFSLTSLVLNDLDRVIVYDTVTTPGQSAAKLTYQFDAFGNRTQRVQQTGAGASLITVTTNYTEYDYLNRLTKLSQTASTNFPNWQNKSAKLDYRADSSLQTITRYSDLTQTTIVVKTDFVQDSAGRLQSITHTKPAPSGSLPISYQYTYFADDRLLQETSSLDGTSTDEYDAYGQLTSSTKTQGTSEAYAYDKTGNRIVGSTVVGKGNRVLNDGTYAWQYDANGNVTRRTTLVSGAATGAYVQYSWDHRNQLTKVEFYNAPVSGTSTLAKTVEYTYDDSSNRINKKLTVPGQAVVSENYVWDGDQLLAMMDTAGAIQHEYFDGTSLDQVFADQTVLSGVLWPLEDRTGTARDVISSAAVNLDHRKLDSFGKITSQTGAAVDYDQFFSGLAWDADSQLYYARARWYDPVAGEFIGEDPLRFGAGDTNLTRYSANDPVNLTDPSGLSWLSHTAKQIGNAFEDVGDFVEKQWDNGNIQKGLLVAGTIASGGALAFGGLAGMGLVAGSLGFASGAVNSYEVFSGNQIGDGTFSRFLGAAAAVTGGFYGNLPTGSTGSITSAKYWTLGRTASAAAGLTSGYEIASGKYIGDGTLSSLLHVTNLGVNHGSTLFNTQASTATRFGVGLNLAVGGASVTSTGDRGLQQALRSLSIAAGVWNTGTEAVMAAQTVRTTLEALRPTPAVAAQARNIEQAGYNPDGFGDVRIAEQRLHEAGVGRTLTPLEAEVAAFMDHLAYEEIWNGPVKSRANVYADMERDIEKAIEAGRRDTANYLRKQLAATKEYDRSQSEDYMYGSDGMATAHERDKQRFAEVVETADIYSFGAMSFMQEVDTALLLAMNKDVYYSSFGEYNSASRVDDLFTTALDPFSAFGAGMSLLNDQRSDPTLDRMGHGQMQQNYAAYRTSGYDPDRDPGRARLMYATEMMTWATGGVAGEFASEVRLAKVFEESRNVFASTGRALWADEVGSIQTGYGAFGWGRGQKDGSQSIFKAPQPGKGQKLLVDGFHPHDFAEGDLRAYFAKERQLAEEYATHYGQSVLEVQIPNAIYDARIRPLEVPYISDPRFIEIPIPHSEFDVLNNAIRRLHGQ